MKPVLMILILLSSLSGSLLAQQKKQQVPTPQERMQALEQAWQAHRQDFFKQQLAAARKARAEAEQARKEGRKAPGIPALQMRVPLGAFVARFQAAAADYAGTDEAVRFLVWIVANGSAAEDRIAQGQALETLTTTHLKSPRLAALPPILGQLQGALGKAKVAALLKRIEQENPDGATRAQAILARISADLRRAPVDSQPYLLARAEAQRAMKLGDTAIQARLQGMINAREQLAMGKVSTDIAGVDLDGTAFKLSDYKGKIIMLDFWGDW